MSWSHRSRIRALATTRRGRPRVTETFNDGGNTGRRRASDSATHTVHLTPVNDPPTLSASATNPTYTEDAAGVAPFSSVSASTIEAGQTITQLVLTVSNVSDGASLCEKRTRLAVPADSVVGELF